MVTRTINGVEYEVVWAGGEGLSGIGDIRRADTWQAPNRVYNKTGKHTKAAKTQGTKLVLDNKQEILDDLFGETNG